MRIKLLDYKKLKETPAQADSSINHDLTAAGLDVFKERLKSAGVSQLAIAGSALIEDYLVMANKSQEDSLNQMIITSPAFSNDQANALISVLPIYLPDEAKFRVSITGMTYSVKNDWIVFVAVRDAKGAAAEKESSKSVSYIGVIENAARKIGRKKMRVNTLAELSSIEKKFKAFSATGLLLQSEKEGRIKANIIAASDKNILHLLHIRIKQ